MKRQRKIDLLVLLGFAVATHILYFQTLEAGFVKDYTGLVERFDNSTIWDFWHSFHFQALQHFTFLPPFIVYKIFGQTPLPWYLLFTTFHILNGFLFYKFGKKILTLFKIRNVLWISLTAAILFLLNPYHNEVLVWRVCFNYLCSTFLILSCLWFVLKFLESPENKFAWWSFLFFFLSIFTFELALVVPFLVVGFFVFYWAFLPPNPLKGERVSEVKTSDSSPFRGLGGKILLPQFLLLIAYFPINKLIVGTWIGHYGADAHLNISPTLLLGNFYKYFIKNLVFLRDLPHLEKQPIIQILENDWNVGFITFFAMVLFILGIVYFKKIHPKLRIAGLFLILFFIGLLPIMNLYFGWIQLNEGDRYSYFAAGFFFLFLMTLISFLPKYLRWFLFLGYLIASIFFLNRVNNYWEKGTEVYFSLLENYRWENEKQVYILACPDNFEGTYLFKDYSKKSLAVKHALIYNLRKKVVGNIQQVAQFNMKKMSDSVTVEIDRKNRMTVRFNQWGNWWWRNGIGARNYETDDYKFWKISNGYRIQFKSEDFPKDAVFIYSDGKVWKEVKLKAD